MNKFVIRVTRYHDVPVAVGGTSICPEVSHNEITYITQDGPRAWDHGECKLDVTRNIDEALVLNGSKASELYRRILDDGVLNQGPGTIDRLRPLTRRMFGLGLTHGTIKPRVREVLVEVVPLTLGLPNRHEIAVIEATMEVDVVNGERISATRTVRDAVSDDPFTVELDTSYPSPMSDRAVWYLTQTNSALIVARELVERHTLNAVGFDRLTSIIKNAERLRDEHIRKLRRDNPELHTPLFISKLTGLDLSVVDQALKES
jgi:hypothetical protein